MPRTSKKAPSGVLGVPAKVPRKSSRKRPSAVAEGAVVMASSGGSSSMTDELEGEQVLLFAGVPGLERIKIFREDERTRKPVFHGNLPQDETTVDRVTELFGGGKYILRATTRDAQGAEVFATARTIVVPGPYKPVTGPLPGVGIATTTGSVAPTVQMVASSGSEIREIMESALAGKLMDLLKPTAPAAVAVPMDWAKMLAAVGTLITAVTPLLESRNKGEPLMLTMFQQLQEEMKALKNTPTPQQSGMKDIMATMRGMAEMKELLGGGSDTSKEEGGDKMWDMASKALSILSGANPPPPVVNDPAVVGAIGGAPAMQPWQQLLVEYAPRLMDSAQRAVEPELVAELVARYVPEQQRGTLMELIQQHNVSELIVSVVPGMGNFPAWLTAFVKACRVELLGEPEEIAENDDAKDE